MAGNATLRPVLHSWGYLDRDYLHLLIPWVDRGMVQGQLLHLEHECLPRLVLFPLSMEAEGHESAFGLPWTLVDGWIPVSVTLLFSLGVSPVCSILEVTLVECFREDIERFGSDDLARPWIDPPVG